MLVSWNWLKDFVALPAAEDAVQRLMMAGLNHESTEPVGDDLAIDLEITSNRPDCLGQIGIAREISVLFGLPLRLPAASPAESTTPISELAKVRIDCLELCPRYTARVIRGVKIGPSPAWLVRRLQTVGVTPVNNVVDITNYVMFECSQPLHAFDLARLQGREIVVREARPKEPFVAIDHRPYTLEPGMCVIADARSAVAVAGVMGGEHSEVTSGTKELLIESAEFAPLAVRTTARKLNLHSPSSYRFERGVDPAGIDWASRRCCELILELAGGELAGGVIDVGRPLAETPRITLRFSQLRRVLGIDVPRDVVCRILEALGNEPIASTPEVVAVRAPTWRRDLTREIDLVEEVARIHGYDKIPEDVAVPMCPSHRRGEERVLAVIRSALVAAGIDEAMTASVVPGAWCAAFAPWSTAPPLTTAMPMLKGADHLRTSLIPSLLEARRTNESMGNPEIELFEIARIYLPRTGQLPTEQWTLGLTSGQDFAFVKGVVESLLEVIHAEAVVEVVPTNEKLLDGSRSCELRVAGGTLAVIGECSKGGLKEFGLRSGTTIAEVNLDLLDGLARLVPQYSELSPYPSIARDLNLIVDEPVRWSELAATIRSAGGPLLESLQYRETYRDPQKDGAGKKRILLSCTLRASDRTLTNEEADAIRDAIVAACAKQQGAQLLG